MIDGHHFRKVEKDENKPEDGATFQRQKGKARRYWCRVNRGIKNFKRRRRARLSDLSSDMDQAVSVASMTIHIGRTEFEHLYGPKSRVGNLGWSLVSAQLIAVEPPTQITFS